VPEPLAEQFRRAYTDFARGNLEAVLELIDPEVELRDRPESPDASTYHGHEGVLESLQKSAETFEELDFIPERFVEQGDHMVVTILMRGRGRGSGVPVEEQIAHLWTIREGKAAVLQVYSNEADALEAAGIRAPRNS
jgi:ketosteroid isomerase-like protein